MNRGVAAAGVGATTPAVNRAAAAVAIMRPDVLRIAVM